MPGRTPMSVPMSVPTNAYSRLVSVSAVAKPRPRLESNSMIRLGSVLHEHRVDRNRQFQAPDEHQEHEDDEADGQRDGFLPLEVVTAEGRDADQRDQRDDQASGPQQDTEQHYGAQHP